MKEKNDELIDNLLGSKFNWWKRLWGQCMKVQRKDSSYQASLVSIREDVVKKNDEEDGEDIAYQVYLDRINNWLDRNKKRLLTEPEEKTVIAHLKSVTKTFSLMRPCRDLGIKQVLAMESAKKVCEMHPDLSTPTEEEVIQKMAEVFQE